MLPTGCKQHGTTRATRVSATAGGNLSSGQYRIPLEYRGRRVPHLEQAEGLSEALLTDAGQARGQPRRNRRTRSYGDSEDAMVYIKIGKPAGIGMHLRK